MVVQSDPISHEVQGLVPYGISGDIMAESPAYEGDFYELFPVETMVRAR